MNNSKKMKKKRYTKVKTARTARKKSNICGKKIKEINGKDDKTL